MPSEIIPSLDLAPSVPSRIVTVHATDLTKGTPQAGATITFKLRGDLRVPADGAIISAGSVTLELDAEGKGRVRLPCYTDDTRADSADGEWYLEVSKSWVGQRDLIRVPNGTSAIALAAIEPVRELPLHMAPSWLVTGAGVEVEEGPAWSATVVVNGGVANFRFIVPPLMPVGMTRGALPDGTDANEAYGPEWNGTWYGNSNFSYQNLPPADLTWFAFTVEHGGDSGVSQHVSWYNVAEERTEFWVRESDNASSGRWGPWDRLLTTSDLDSFSPDAQTVTDLAARDGWYGVYDPTNPNFTDLDENGRLRRIRDSVGNLPPLVAPAAARPELVEGGFGAIRAINLGQGDSWLRSDWGAELDEQCTIVMLAHNTTPSTDTSHRFLFDGAESSARNSFLITLTGGFWAGFDGVSNLAGQTSDTAPHVFTTVFDGDHTYSIIDGQLNQYGGVAQNPHRLSGLTIGADYDRSRRWHGTVGPVLIYKGRPPSDVLNRMTKLLHSLSGIPYQPPAFSPETRVVSVDGWDTPTLTVGDPDAFGRSSIQSVTKVMTVWLARKWLPTDEDLDSTVTIHPDDVNNTIYRAGDVISHRDMMYAAALPSSNAMPAALARSIGQKMLDSEGDTTMHPRLRFVIEMELEAAALGLEGVSFTNPWSRGMLTPRQTVALFRHILQDPALREIFGARTHTLNIGGPEARTMTVTHTIVSNAPAPIDYVAGKTGTGFGVGHVVLAWEHPDGSEHVTAIMDTDSDHPTRRYEEFRKVWAALTHGGPTGMAIAGGTSDTERTTQTRDISQVLGALEGDVYLARNGNMCAITFDQARMPADLNLQNILPVWYRPDHSVGTLLATDQAASTGTVWLQVYPGGSVRLYGNTDTDVLRGTLSWPIQSSRFAPAPFIGRPTGVLDGPG